MFQKKDIEAYRETQAPVELKNRIQISIEQQRKKIRKQQIRFIAVAATFVILISAGGLFDNSNTILFVNDRVVSEDAVELSSLTRRSMDTAIQVPLEIQATESTKVQVSQGTLQLLEADGTSKKCTELEINEKTVIYWTVEGNTTNNPTCTITTNNKNYVYVIVYDDTKSVFIIKQEK